MRSKAAKLATICLMWGIATPLARADDWVSQLVARKPSAQEGDNQRRSHEATTLLLSDSEPEPTGARSALSDEPVSLRFHDNQSGEAEALDYPSCVSHDPGKPRKPQFTRPGDIDNGTSPSNRYCLKNCERAGHPHEVAWWARCAVNPNYSAAFVGGGTPWVLPHKTRSRERSEGTWGLDYDGIFKPRRVWLSWSCDRKQGGLGSYASDGAPAIVERVNKVLR